MTSQNEPPRIQQEGRQIEVGKETDCGKAKPTKSEIEATRGQKISDIAKKYGVCRGTIYHWYKTIDEGRELFFRNEQKPKQATRIFKNRPNKTAIALEHGVSRESIRAWMREGIDITDKKSVEQRKLMIGKVRAKPKNAVPCEVKNMAKRLAEIEGIGYGAALTRLKNGTAWPNRHTGIKTTLPYMGRPSYWNQLQMVQYRTELRAFPDWGCLWKRYLENKRRKEEWAAMSIEEKRKKYRAPKDMERRRQKLREADRRRCRESPHYRTINALQSRFRKFFIGGTSKSIRKLIGCTLPEFKKHLESQFKKGMTWQNYGTYWHVDHIIPCAHFDHSDQAQVAICWHWSNMQPLEAKKNMSKGKRIENPQMNLRMEFAA